mgnify:CR=1 FL=1
MDDQTIINVNVGGEDEKKEVYIGRTEDDEDFFRNPKH